MSLVISQREKSGRENIFYPCTSSSWRRKSYFTSGIAESTGLSIVHSELAPDNANIAIVLCPCCFTLWAALTAPAGCREVSSLLPARRGEAGFSPQHPLPHSSPDWHPTATPCTFSIGFSSFSCLLFHLQNEKQKAILRRKSPFCQWKSTGCPMSLLLRLSACSVPTLEGERSLPSIHSHFCWPSFRDGDTLVGSMSCAQPSLLLPGHSIPSEKLWAPALTGAQCREPEQGAVLYLHKGTLEITYLNLLQLLSPEGLLGKAGFIHTLISRDTRRLQQGSGRERKNTAWETRWEVHK